MFAWFRYFEFRVVSSGEPEIVLQNLVYGSIIITAWVGGDFVYVVYCILRYSDVIPVIPVIPVFVCTEKFYLFWQWYDNM